MFEFNVNPDELPGVPRRKLRKDQASGRSTNGKKTVGYHCPDARLSYYYQQRKAAEEFNAQHGPVKVLVKDGKVVA